MQNAVLKKWQRSWGTALALLALLAWCMPSLATACVVSAVPSAAFPNCYEMNLSVLPDTADMQLMPCCQKVPLPQSQSTNAHSAVLSTDGHVQVSSVNYPPPHAPLWALLIVSANYDVDVKTVFPLENFSPPPAVYAVSQLADRAPPFLI